MASEEETTWVTKHTVQRDGVRYPPGAEITFSREEYESGEVDRLRDLDAIVELEDARSSGLLSRLFT